MEYLRWILLAAGILFVLFVYIVSRRRNSKPVTYSYTESEDIEGFTATDLDSVDEGVGEVRVIARGGYDALQGDVDDGDDIDIQTQSEPDGSAETGIITVFIMSQSKEQAFQGDKINSAARSCGMTFGDMNIFHKLDDDDQPTFSMANMLKPGSFDPAELFDTRTTGLVVFLQLDAVDDAGAILDDMLATSYRISEILGGQLCNHRREAISQQDTEEYRKQAADN